MNNSHYILDDYAADATPGWVQDFESGHQVFTNPTYGTLEIGQVPNKGYDQWLFHENGGGGALAVGYHHGSDGLEVLMLIADRFNLKKDDDHTHDHELPGGFLENGEAGINAGLRELLEETGLKVSAASALPGRGYVGNRTFFALDGENEGTTVVYFPLSEAHVQKIKASDNLVLMHWTEAIQKSRDALSIAGIGRLMAHFAQTAKV